MQIEELQGMTVLQLRKLAKENGVKLCAGIDKEGIVKRIAESVSDIPSREESAPKSAAADGGMQRLQEAPLSADVTSLPPTNNYQSWNAPRPEEQDGFRPVYRQAWQARSAAQQRDGAPRPAWQTPQRAGGSVNRFGPQTPPPVQREPALRPEFSERPVEERQPVAMEPSARPIEPAPRVPDAAPKLDGYRLGYRAAPQRTPYQSRDGGYQSRDGGYQQSGYRQNNYYRPTPYRANSYDGYPTQTQGYAPRGADNRGGDGVYRMARDPQFAEQAENGQLPELLKPLEGEAVSGILEVLPDGYGFLRDGTLLPGKKDTYVSMAQIRRFDLRTGDMVEGKARVQREMDRYAALLLVERVNGQEAVENPKRLSFDDMAAIYPTKRISLESKKNEKDMVIRLIDLIAPIGFGQRAMIVSRPQSDGLRILRDISHAIKENDKDAQVFMLLIDVAPEDVTEIRESSQAEVYASTFADAPEMQARVSETMLERAERMVENGRNVVILLDSLTKLTRAYQGVMSQGGRPMNNTVTPTALVRPKRFFGAARNTREGGSLTVVATINTDTGSRVDDIIFEEFKGTANMELFLLSPTDSDPIRPMIDLQRSGTKKDDMLLSEERKESLRSIRRVLGSTTNGEAVVQLIDMMSKTKSNEDLLSRLKDWVALWEKSGYLKR